MKSQPLVIVTPDQQRIEIPGADIHEMIGIQILAGVQISVDYRHNTIYQLKHGWLKPQFFGEEN